MDSLRSNLYSHLGMDMDSDGIMTETRNFSYAELQCKCGCGGNEMKPEFLNKLQAIRDEFKKPMRINSGFRCSNHDANVSSSKIAGKGPHTTGHAKTMLLSMLTEKMILKLTLTLLEWAADRTTNEIDNTMVNMMRSQLQKTGVI